MPERLAGSVPPIVVEIAIGVAMAGLMTLLRIALVPLTGDRSPYALVFVAVIGASVLAGWRSGLLALVIGQSLSWMLVIDPASYELQKDRYVAGLAVAVVAQLMVLAIIALYQREVERAWSRREDQMDLLEKALKEIDHRTANNYQTVLALVLAQAKSSDDAVRDALIQVADRIRAIAEAQRKLALASISLERVLVGEHLQDLCANLKRGLAGPEVTIDCAFDAITLGADETICVSILVNELVTNALKHAFPNGRPGTIQVALRTSGRAVELIVEDDGIGIDSSVQSQGTGLGSRLVETFVRQLKAKHEVASAGTGTRHRIRIPA